MNYGFIASRELLEVARKPLEALRDDLDWSTHLGVLDRRNVLYLMRYPATDGLSSLVHVGSRLPAFQTAMGRLLIAHKTEAEIRRLMSDRPAREFASTLARREGDRGSETVVHQGQFESGLCSVAAPVHDMSGRVVAAISATKSAETVGPDIPAAVLKAAHAFSRGLGAS